jgi:hypothetical protein
MTTEVLCILATALKTFLAEKAYAQQTQERLTVLEAAGLSFSPNEIDGGK